MDAKMDVVSDVLTLIPVVGRTTGLLDLRGAWAFDVSQGKDAVFYLVSSGSMTVTFEKMKFQLLDKRLRNEIQKQLLKVGVVVKNISQQVHFDTEEACLSQSGGDWSHRLAQNIVMQKAKPTVRSKRQH